MVEAVRSRQDCRVCGSKQLQEVANYGNMPLANALYDTPSAAKLAERYPLALCRCQFCQHLQLSHVVAPEILYGAYTYRSGVAKSWYKHCHHLAESLPSKPKTWIDIGANDGTQCKAAKAVFPDCQVIGVDPMPAIPDGFKWVSRYWGADTGKLLRESGIISDVITAQNVLAHCDDWDDFFQGITRVLSATGKLVLEFPYALDTILGLEIDQVYHEHLSYILLGPLQRILRRHQLGIAYVEELATHGGSLRVVCNHATWGDISGYIRREEKLGIGVFTAAVEQTPQRLQWLVKELGVDGALGASAKGTIMANLCRFTPTDVPRIVDDTPGKQMRYQPGTGTLIISSDMFKGQHPDPGTALVYAWNHYYAFRDQYPGWTLITPHPPRAQVAPSKKEVDG